MILPRYYFTVTMANMSINSFTNPAPLAPHGPRPDFQNGFETISLLFSLVKFQAAAEKHHPPIFPLPPDCDGVFRRGRECAGTDLPRPHEGPAIFPLPLSYHDGRPEGEGVVLHAVPQLPQAPALSLVHRSSQARPEHRKDTV